MGIDSPSDAEAVYRIATANRLLAADMFADLTPEQWRTPSLCAGWTVREGASTRLTPPVIGPLGPMTDTCIHLRDAARPLGLDVSPSPASWRPALDFLVSKPATKGFVPRDRLAGLRLVATDQDWQHGDGAEILGTSEAIAVAVSGRPAALDDLAGPGLDVLRRRITPSAPAAP